MSLPALPKPKTRDIPAWHITYYTAEQMQAYGQQCREAALEEAISAIEYANARRVIYLPDAIEIIRSLK